MIHVDLRQKRVFIALHLVWILPIMTCTILNRGKMELKMDHKGLRLKLGKKALKQRFLHLCQIIQISTKCLPFIRKKTQISEQTQII